ncbi:4'-phosphopantetheinyl transferase family protein [Corynebacterium halotolerans]|uniref:4'-phosphopantetheinyl transferase family protein n=1 Tax=Corynebacterium halotolerans TaxID=225326 RepID=UPI003CED11E6
MDLDGYRVPLPRRFWRTPAPPPGELSVHAVPVAAALPLLDGGVRHLGEAELRQATRPAAPATQQLRLASHLLLRRLLAERLRVADSALVFTRAAGRLHLRTAGEIVPVPQFSLSRSSGLIAVAISPEGVGVDVEDLQTPAEARLLLATLHESDQRRLSRLPGPLQARAVTAAWTRKEAGLKALGTGLNRDPARDRTGSRRRPLGPPGVQVAQLTLPRPRRVELAVAWRG